MQKITVHTGRPYDILIDDGLLEQAGDLVRRVSGAKRICLISDSNVYPLYGDRVVQALESADFQVCTLVFDAGEASKKPETVLNMVNYMAREGLTRGDLVVALGGGVVGDAADHAVHGHFRRPIGAVFRQGQGKLRRLPRGGLNAQAVVLRHLHRGAARAGIGPALFPGGHAVKAAVVPHAGAQAPHQGRDRQEHCGGQFDFPDDAFHDGFPHLSSEFPSVAAVVLCTVMLLYLCRIVNEKKCFRFNIYYSLWPPISR